jgi:hypothetical protein
MRWLGLNDALKHITSTKTCTSVEAQRHLKAKIGDETIPVKWSDSAGVKDIPDPRHLRGTKFNLSGPGLAHDKHKYRPLMVLHSALLTAWQNKTLISNAELSKEFASASPDLLGDCNDNDKSQWMTLVSAEEHIEVLKNCDSVEALRQLKEEIGDGIVKVQWADEPVDKPDVVALRGSQFILFGSGLAPDGTELRQLLVNFEDILRLWPKERDVENTPAEPSNAKSRVGRPTKRDLVWETLFEMQRQGKTIKGNRTQIARTIIQFHNVSFEDDGWDLGTVLGHIRAWIRANAPGDAKMRK